MKPKHTGNMPWDNLWDHKYYKISKVRMRTFTPLLYKELIRDAVEDERKRCVDMFVKWGIENLSLHDFELLEYFIADRLEGE